MKGKTTKRGEDGVSMPEEVREVRKGRVSESA